jgi:hypothetical protein
MPDDIDFGDSDAADRSEAEHKMFTAGLVARTPAQAMKIVSELFPPEVSATDLDEDGDLCGVHLVLDRIQALPTPELKQLLYECRAAEAGAKNLSQAMESILIVRLMSSGLN